MSGFEERVLSDVKNVLVGDSSVKQYGLIKQQQQ